MPDLEYFVVARGASVDRFTDRVSIFSIIDEITPRRFPAILMQIAVIAGWNAAQEEIGQQANLRIRFTLPGQQEPAEMPLEFTVEARRHRHISQFMGLRLAASGELVVVVEMNGQERAHHRILINAPDANAPPDGWLVYEAEPPAVPAPAQGEVQAH
jgi:hypothetical protein